MATTPVKPARLAPPPDYRSRKMQLRLFAIVVVCMGGLYLVTERLNPWREVPPPPAQPPEVAAQLAAPPQQSTPPGVVTIADPFRGTAEDEAAFRALDPVARTLADGWSAYFKQSSRDEHELIAGALRRLEGEDFSDEAWISALEGMDQFWDGYRARAIDSLEKSVPEAERAAWIGALDKVAAAWQADRAALAALSNSEELPPAAVERLRVWRLRWEQLALATIEDDTLHRPVEADAWFRLFDVLARLSLAEFERQPAERVTFAQLHKQSGEFRGKLVRISGRVMQAKKIAPTKNAYGIQEQYLLWIKPEGGSSPLVVYVLELPAGFPSLDEPNIDGGYTKLREDVEITGYFFKRWAYRAQQGTFTAPLILAKSPRWIPGANLDRSDALPSRSTILLWLAGSAASGIGVAALVYALSRRRSPALESLANSPAAQRELAASLKGAHAGPSVLEALRELEERDRTGR